MTNGNGLARIGDAQMVVAQRVEVAPLEFNSEQRAMIRATFANGASDEEFAVLMEIARQRRLNPLLKQIHFVKRWTPQGSVWSVQASIDGLRAIAERTGLYAGQDKPVFEENPDGTIKSCEVGVWRKDWPRPAVGVAYWSEYVQTTRDKQSGKERPNAMWARMPRVMLAKCAESIALRKAFPEDMGGIYSDEEMGQADDGRERRVTLEEINAARAGWEHDEGREVTKAVPGAAPQLPASAAVVASFSRALSDVGSLSDATALWSERAQDLHGAGAASDAKRAVADHLDALGYPLVAAHLQAVLAGNLPGPLAGLYEALAKLSADSETPAADAARILADRKPSLAGPLYAEGYSAARRRLTAMGVEAADIALKEAVAGMTVQTTPETPPANDAAPTVEPMVLDRFGLRVGTIELPGEAVSVWLKFRGELSTLSAASREIAWAALCRRTEEVGKMKNAKVWLKKAIAEEDARRGTNHPTDGAQTSSRPEPRDPSDDGPRGGGSPRPQAPEATDARGSQHAVAPAEGMVDAITTSDGEVLSTVADVVAYLGTVENLPHYEAWCRKHGAHRLAVQCADVVADRLITLDAAANADGSTIDRRAARERVAAWAKAGPKQRAQGRAVQQRRAA